MEQKDMVIEKVGWITRMKSTPPLTEEYINNQYLRFELMIKFLQDNGFTTHTILKEGDKVNDDTELKKSDLTAAGLEFYKSGIIPWIKKIDRSKDQGKAIRDISFLEKKLKEFNEVQK